MIEKISPLGTQLILAVEILGSTVMMFYVVKAWGELLAVKPRRAKAGQLLAEGAINTLSFKLAATLLKTLYMHTWSQIAVLAAIVLLRTLLKRLFVWEQQHLGYIKA